MEIVSVENHPANIAVYTASSMGDAIRLADEALCSGKQGAVWLVNESFEMAASPLTIAKPAPNVAELAAFYDYLDELDEEIVDGKLVSVANRISAPFRSGAIDYWDTEEIHTKYFKTVPFSRESLPAPDKVDPRVANLIMTAARYNMAEALLEFFQKQEWAVRIGAGERGGDEIDIHYDGNRHLQDADKERWFDGRDVRVIQTEGEKGLILYEHSEEPDVLARLQQCIGDQRKSEDNTPVLLSMLKHGELRAWETPADSVAFIANISWPSPLIHAPRPTVGRSFSNGRIVNVFDCSEPHPRA